MATYELQGGEIYASLSLGGGQIFASPSLGGGEIYAGGGGGGGNLQPSKSVSYTPTESAQSATVTPDYGYDGMEEVSVSVGAIPSDYVGSDIPLCDSSDVETAITDTNFIRSHTVNVADGYYENSVSLLNPFGEAVFDGMHTPHIDPSTGDLTVTFSADTAGMAYTKGTYTLTQDGAFNVKGAQTYTPGTTDQTINSGYLLTGNQTILGDADLVAENIKKDVEIFGVTGTYEGGSPAPDPYHLKVDAENLVFGFGAPNYSSNKIGVSNEAGTRRNILAATGDTNIYYANGSSRINWHLIPIPNDATTMTVTIDKACEMSPREYTISNGSVMAYNAISWTSVSANVGTSFTLTNGATHIGIALRVSSSGSYSVANEPTTATIDFS